MPPLAYRPNYWSLHNILQDNYIDIPFWVDSYTFHMGMNHNKPHSSLDLYTAIHCNTIAVDAYQPVLHIYRRIAAAFHQLGYLLGLDKTILYI